MSSDHDIETVRRLLDEIFSQGKYEIIDQLVAPDFVEHQNGVQGDGVEALLSVAKGLRASFPDLHLEMQDVATGADTVWVRVRGRGTDTGGVAGRPPSGRSIEVDVIDVTRLHDGRIVEHWGVADRLGMLQQVGVVPAQQHAA